MRLFFAELGRTIIEKLCSADFQSKLEGYLESGGKSPFAGEGRIFLSDGNDYRRHNKLAFLFGGNADLTMPEIKHLYDSEPVFREAFSQSNNSFMPAS